MLAAEGRPVEAEVQATQRFLALTARGEVDAAEAALDAAIAASPPGPRPRVEKRRGALAARRVDPTPYVAPPEVAALRDLAFEP